MKIPSILYEVNVRDPFAYMGQGEQYLADILIISGKIFLDDLSCMQ
jgi:hypothetical protein